MPTETSMRPASCEPNEASGSASTATTPTTSSVPGDRAGRSRPPEAMSSSSRNALHRGTSGHLHARHRRSQQARSQAQRRSSCAVLRDDEPWVTDRRPVSQSAHGDTVDRQLSTSRVLLRSPPSSRERWRTRRATSARPDRDRPHAVRSRAIDLMDRSLLISDRSGWCYCHVN